MGRPPTPPATPAQRERAARIAARARWGEPRIVRLDALDPAVRRAVVALIEADRESKAAAETSAD